MHSWNCLCRLLPARILGESTPLASCCEAKWGFRVTICQFLLTFFSLPSSVSRPAMLSLTLALATHGSILPSFNRSFRNLERTASSGPQSRLGSVGAGQSSCIIPPGTSFRRVLTIASAPRGGDSVYGRQCRLRSDSARIKCIGDIREGETETAGVEDSKRNDISSAGSGSLLTLPTILTLVRVAAVPALIAGKTWLPPIAITLVNLG